ncbi:MAG TPA: N-acetyltransferase [Brevibacillus sp.]|nr:N-acetyltransferase [Brevibacillus sp.]
MIRKALPADVKAVAPLIIEAIGLDIAHSLTGANEYDEAVQRIASYFVKSQNRLSYENVIVATDRERVVGFALFYHGSQTERLDRPFVEGWLQRTGQAPVIVKEARDDEFYLDSLAVHPDCRRMGVGKSLLYAFEKEAEARGHDRVALIVEEANAKARKLYESIGFRPDGSLMVAGHLYHHMVKRVPVLV